MCIENILLDIEIYDTFPHQYIRSHYQNRLTQVIPLHIFQISTAYAQKYFSHGFDQLPKLSLQTLLPCFQIFWNIFCNIDILVKKNWFFRCCYVALWETCVASSKTNAGDKYISYNFSELLRVFYWKVFCQNRFLDNKNEWNIQHTFNWPFSSAIFVMLIKLTCQIR